jgi:hypothetical protein
MFVVDISSLMPPPVKEEPAAEPAAAEGEAEDSKPVKIQVDAAAAVGDTKESAAEGGAEAMDTDKPAGDAAAANGAAEGEAKEGGDTTMTDADGAKVSRGWLCDKEGSAGGHKHGHGSCGWVCDLGHAELRVLAGLVDRLSWACRLFARGSRKQPAVFIMSSVVLFGCFPEPDLIGSEYAETQ